MGRGGGGGTDVYTLNTSDFNPQCEKGQGSPETTNSMDPSGGCRRITAEFKKAL